MKPNTSTYASVFRELQYHLLVTLLHPVVFMTSPVLLIAMLDIHFTNTDINLYMYMQYLIFSCPTFSLHFHVSFTLLCLISQHLLTCLHIYFEINVKVSCFIAFETFHPFGGRVEAVRKCVLVFQMVCVRFLQSYRANGTRKEQATW